MGWRGYDLTRVRLDSVKSCPGVELGWIATLIVTTDSKPSGAWGAKCYSQAASVDVNTSLWHWPNRLLARMGILLKIRASKH